MPAVRRKFLRALGSTLLFWPLLTGAVGQRANFDARILAAHNRERSSVGVPPLRWNAELAAGAQQWSDHLARTQRFEHSPDAPGAEQLGENIWGGDPDAFSPEAMVSLWIAEKRYFRPATFAHASLTGDIDDIAHYTQVVWRTTDEVGCGLSRGPGEDVLVCRYRGPGNVIGQEVF